MYLAKSLMDSENLGSKCLDYSIIRMALKIFTTFFSKLESSRLLRESINNKGKIKTI